MNDAEFTEKREKPATGHGDFLDAIRDTRRPVPPPGAPVRWAREPIRRNAPCPCRSGRKFKNCCIPR